MRVHVYLHMYVHAHAWYDVFFIHSSVDGHLGCPHGLALVTGAAVNTGTLFGTVFAFPSDKYLEVGLVDHLVVLFLIFWGNAILFSTVVAQIYIPTNGAQEFPFLHIYGSIRYFLSFW